MWPTLRQRSKLDFREHNGGQGRCVRGLWCGAIQLSVQFSWRRAIVKKPHDHLGFLDYHSNDAITAPAAPRDRSRSLTICARTPRPTRRRQDAAVGAHKLRAGAHRPGAYGTQRPGLQLCSPCLVTTPPSPFLASLSAASPSLAPTWRFAEMAPFENYSGGRAGHGVHLSPPD